jgi:hypothetical protein
MGQRVIGWIGDRLLVALLWALRRRDEVEIANKLRARDWDGYARAEMAYWRRWEQ